MDFRNTRIEAPRNARQQRAALMQQAKKEQAKKARAKQTAKPKPEPIYYSANRMDGTGFWVHQSKPESPPHSPPPEPKTSLNVQIQAKLATDMVKMLQSRCSHLAKQLDEATIQKKTAENKMHLLQQKLYNQISAKQNLQRELAQLHGHQESLEKEMDEFTIYRNYVDTKLSSLQQEVENECQRAESYKKLYEQESQSKEEEITQYEAEIESLKQQIQEYTVQIGQMMEFLKKLQEENQILTQHRSGVASRITEQTPNTEEERDKAKLKKMNLLVCENKTQQRKIKEMEEARDRNHQVLKKKDQEIKSLKHEIENWKGKIRAEQSARTHQNNLLSQRDSKLMILQERYNKLEQQFKALVDENSKPKPPPAKLVKVSANPELFS